MSTPEYASRAELEQMRADLDDARQALRRETRTGTGGGDAPLTRAELRRALDEFREDVQDELRRAYRRGAEAERAAVAQAVCDELDSRYIDDLDVDEVEDRIGKRGGGNGKAKAGTKPARGEGEPKAKEPRKELDRQGWLERLMAD